MFMPGKPGWSHLLLGRRLSVHGLTQRFTRERALDPELEKEIERLRHSKVKALQERYRELFGEDSPSSNRAHLFRRIAWRLQARGTGELSERAQQRAVELADDAELRRRAPRSFWRAMEARTSADTHRDPRLPEAGSRLTRSYQERAIEVRVLETGFEYNGAVYASLSAVARQVTGTRWNGFLFFGIEKARRG
jgi:hypothetical protein